MSQFLCKEGMHCCFDLSRENLRQKYPSERYYSGPLSNRQKRDINNYASANMHSLDDISEGTVVQQKGRFKVTSADVGLKGSPPNRPVNPIGQASTNSTTVAASLLPSLQYLLQQNALQREQIIKLTKCAEQTSGHQMEIPDAFSSDLPQLSPALNRETELQSQVLRLQQSIESTAKELQMLKMKNAQLERQLNALVWNKEEEERTWRENEQ